MGEVNNGRRRKRLIAVCLIGAAVLLGLFAYLFYFRNLITAVTMRIQRLVGTVSLYNDSGDEQSLKEKIRLGAGQTITTAGSSLIMVSLDDTKLLTMEESSRADIKANGKKLEFDLLEGNLFFNVTKKLGEGEAFNVNTSTMVCGIRGTSAYIGRDATGHEILMVTDGIVNVRATNPVTLETIEENVPAGQMRTVYLDEEAKGDATISFGRDAFVEEDLPALALDTMRKNPELMKRIAKATGFSEKKLTTLAELSCTEGVSMYGSAADDLTAAGIEDAIPYMGDKAGWMVENANSALIAAGEDLPLEVAIIEGYRNVMDTVAGNGYDTKETDMIMDSTRDCIESVFESADQAELSRTDRLSVAYSVTDSVWVAGVRMSEARKLLASEIVQVTDTVKTLYVGAIDNAAASSAASSKGSAAVKAVNNMSKHVTTVVTDQMNRSSNGDQTVEALLLQTPLAKGQAADPDDKKKMIEEAKQDAKIPELGDTTSAADAMSVPEGDGASYSEMKSAASAVIATDPATGIVALADGTLFDPAFYAASNPDVVRDYGTSTPALLAHYLKRGKAEGRPPIAPVTLTPTPTPVPEWLWKQWQREQEESGPDPYAEEEEESEPAPSATPTQPPPPPAATTASIDGSGNITDGYGNVLGSVSAASGTPKFIASKTGSFIDFPLSVTDGNGNEQYRFNTLRDVDLANCPVDTMIRDTQKNNGANIIKNSTSSGGLYTTDFADGDASHYYQREPEATVTGVRFPALYGSP